MKSVYLPEKELLPNVRMARLYDTEQDRKKGAKIPRVSDCYELSCYISAGGILTVDDSFHALQAGDGGEGFEKAHGCLRDGGHGDSIPHVPFFV